MIQILRKILVPAAPVAIVGLALPPVARAARESGILTQLHLLGMAFFLAVLLTPAMGWFARRIGALDHPDPRKIHAVPTPLLGGVAVFGAFFAAHFIHFTLDRQMIGIFIGALLILMVGAIDDKTGGISARYRLLAQIAASAIVICFGVSLHLFPFTTWGKALSIFLTIFWIVGITNAVNFLDGMDGLAAGLSATAAGIFFVIAYRLNAPYLGFISITLCGAALGFLVHNFTPATIFLGDAGATFLGFTLACFGVMGNWANANPVVSFSVPILILGIPIFDMIHTTVERIATGKVRNFGEWLAYTGKDHFHHRLADHGFKVNEVVIFACFLNITIGLSAVVIAFSSTDDMAILLAQACCLFLIITILMNYAAAKRNFGDNGNGKNGPNGI